MEDFQLHPIGIVRSPLKSLEDCPLQGNEGAPEAWIDMMPAYTAGLEDIHPGSEVILLTWFHKADRSVVQCHRRNETEGGQFGVFSTRSPDRPNPVGLHHVKVLEVNKSRLRVFPLEALDGTPVIDIKPA
jgi:tRNA-Thr(GGU) m(6)t(6)A37 methyltransferase TsaA